MKSGRPLQLQREVGIKGSYPRLKARIGRLAGYIQLVRPFTLLAPLFAGIFGTLAPVGDISFTHIKTAIYAGVTLALAQATGQCLNQYADSELDKVVKPYRPIPSGLVSREEALGLAWLLALTSMARAFTISVFFGLTVIVLLFFSVFYSLSPFSPRRVHPFLNVLWMAISRGFIPMFAVWSIYGNPFSSLKYATLAFLWVLGLQSTKDIPDVEGDRLFGIKTIPNTYGVKALSLTIMACTTIYAIIAIIVAPIMLILCPFGLIAALTLKRQSILTENTVSWQIYYLGLGAIYIITFINTHLGIS